MMRLEHDWLPVDMPDNVDLGPNVYLHSSFAFRHYRSVRPCGVRIGEHTARYDATMFDLGPRGAVAIGCYGVINSTHFVADSRIVVGDFVYTSYEVYIADAPAPRPPVDERYEARNACGDDEPSIVIGDDCWIGLRSVVLAGARLGRGVIVGAGSVVADVVPDYCIVAGNPARVVGHVRPGEGDRGGQDEWWKT
jgi:acetyltransferase-like isoleucine patch superfamily enzyme